LNNPVFILFPVPYDSVLHAKRYSW